MFTIQRLAVTSTLAALLLGFPVNNAFAQPGQGIPAVPNINNPYGHGDNPFTPFHPGGPGTNINQPYGWYPPGWGPNIYYPNPFSGIADIINANSQASLNQELGRKLREKAFQEFLTSKKAAIELARWIEETTPTFGEKRAKEIAERLKRIQESATPREIWSGRALNILLKDLVKFNAMTGGEKFHTISEDTLRHLNVTVRGGGSLGLLRNEGRFDWPLALINLAEEQTRESISVDAQDLLNQAKSSGKVNTKTLLDLSTRVRALRDGLDAKAAKVSARQYIDAQRFLDDFQAAIRALEKANVVVQYFNFHQWAKGGKTAPEIVDYVQKNGIIVGPAIEGDEAAYEAIYNAFARLDIFINTRVARIAPKGNN